MALCAMTERCDRSALWGSPTETAAAPTPLRRALRATSPQGEAYFHLEPIGNKKTICERNLLHLDLVYIDVKYGMHRAM